MHTDHFKLGIWLSLQPLSCIRLIDWNFVWQLTLVAIEASFSKMLNNWLSCTNSWVCVRFCLSWSSKHNKVLNSNQNRKCQKQTVYSTLRWPLPEMQMLSVFLNKHHLSRNLSTVPNGCSSSSQLNILLFVAKCNLLFEFVLNLGKCLSQSLPFSFFPWL